jgi:hypothetical protein
MSSKVNKVIRFGRGACRRCITQPKEALLLLRMAWWVSVLSAAAKVCPLPRALDMVSGPANSNTHDFDPDLPNRLARSIDTLLSANFLHFTPVCWKRAAVLRRYLSRNGIDTTIQFGVRTEEIGRVDGHAWLELNGKPFLETAPAEYVVTYTYPSDKPYRSDAAVLSQSK